MFDEIFKRWIETGRLSSDDLIPILLEYDQVFNEGKTTPQEITLLLQHPLIQVGIGPAVINALRLTAIKKGIVWTEVYSPQGELLTRFIN